LEPSKPFPKQGLTRPTSLEIKGIKLNSRKEELLLTKSMTSAGITLLAIEEFIPQ
jgi:hypothetical protein